MLLTPRCSLDEPDEHFYDTTLRNNTIAQLTYAANLYHEENRPFAVFAGFARPHAPWRVPKRFWDLYKDEEVAPPVHRLPPNGMPGIAWYSQGFYNAADGKVYMPNITQPVDAWATQQMRHAYQAAVSFLDHNIGLVLDTLDESLGLAKDTVVVFHGDHGFQLGVCS